MRALEVCRLKNRRKEIAGAFQDMQRKEAFKNRDSKTEERLRKREERIHNSKNPSFRYQSPKNFHEHGARAFPRTLNGIGF